MIREGFLHFSWMKTIGGLPFSRTPESLSRKAFFGVALDRMKRGKVKFYEISRISNFGPACFRVF
jgi:hypothetical protein